MKKLRLKQIQRSRAGKISSRERRGLAYDHGQDAWRNATGSEKRYRRIRRLKNRAARKSRRINR